MSQILNKNIFVSVNNNKENNKINATVRNLPTTAIQNKPVFHTITAKKLVPAPIAHTLPVLNQLNNSSNHLNLNNFNTNSPIFTENVLNKSSSSSSNSSNSSIFNLDNNKKNNSFYAKLLAQSNNYSLNFEDYLFKPLETVDQSSIMTKNQNNMHNSSVVLRNNITEFVNKQTINNKLAQPPSTKSSNKITANNSINIISDKLNGLSLNNSNFNDIDSVNNIQLNHSPSGNKNYYTNNIYAISNNLNVTNESLNTTNNSNTGAFTNPTYSQLNSQQPVKMNEQFVNDSVYGNYDAKTNTYRYDKQTSQNSNYLTNLNPKSLSMCDVGNKNCKNSPSSNTKLNNLATGGSSAKSNDDEVFYRLINDDYQVANIPLTKNNNNFYQESLRQMNEEEKELLKNHYAKFENESYLTNIYSNKGNIKQTTKKLEPTTEMDKIEVENQDGGSSSDFDYEEHDSFEIFY